MGGIGGLLGTAGGAGGTGFAGPANGSIQTPTTNAQATTAYGQAQQGLQQQQDLLTALQGQGGLQNQSQVYNQLQNVAAGQGPNPAQAQLAQATGANTANQAALMAGQRGASQNVGLMARQAAQQGAANQQNSAGQAATLQAQQSLNAIQGAGNMANTQAGQQIGATSGYTQAAQNEQANLLNSIAGQNSSNVAMQSNINNVNGQLANTQLQGQQAMIGGLMNTMGGGGLSSMMGAKGGKVTRKGFDDGGDVQSEPSVEAPSTQISAPVSDAGDFGSPTQVAAAPSVNASTPSFGSDAGASALEQGMSGGGGKSGGGGGGGMSSMMGLLALMADGGEVEANSQSQTPDSGYGGQSKFGKYLHSTKVNAQSTPAAESTPNYGNPGANALYQGVSSLGKNLMQPSSPKNMSGMLPASNTDQPTPNQNGMFAAAKGGNVPALVSPGEQYLPPEDVKKVAKDGKNPLEVGERIPGKPKHPGNDYRNDTVKKTLKSGGIVIPNKIMQSKNPHIEAMKFVHAHIAKNRKGLK